MKLRIERIYGSAPVAGEYRVLVDRIWPRGVSKEKAALDHWDKEVAPSNELRKWFGHKPELFSQFQKKYFMELAVNPAISEFIGQISKHPKVVLLYSAKDEEHNQAVVLQQYIEKHL